MNTPYFENVKKNFGFGCMRLPMTDGQVDYEETKKMVDTFWKTGSTTLTPPTDISAARVRLP